MTMTKSQFKFDQTLGSSGSHILALLT